MRILSSGAIRSAVLAVSIAGLTACAGQPKNVLVPVAAGTPGTSEVDMVVATMRDRSDQPGAMFSGERGRDLEFAEIVVSIPPESARKVGEVQWPRRLPPDPATEFAAVKAAYLSRDEAVAWFHKAVGEAPGHGVLVFVHGFNNRFDDAVFRFAQIVHDSGTEAVPILFTWPSRGSVLAYGYDRESTNYSRDALENLLQALDRDPAVGEVSILAHSMGNWLTLEALRQMAIRDGRIAPKIRNVMMAAPDVDVDVFGGLIEGMGRPRPDFTLFVSRDDRALAVSRRVWGSTVRLGAIDPEAEPYRSQLSENNITVVDLTKLEAGDAAHHAKFAQSPAIVRLIGQRLVDGQTITDSRVGLGEQIVEASTGLTATVGTAAGLVLAAPVAVLDPVTRENYGSHLEEFGKGITEIGDAAPAPQPVDCPGPEGKGTGQSCGR